MANGTLNTVTASDGIVLRDEIKRFAESIDCLLLSLPNVMAILETQFNQQQNEFSSFLEKVGNKSTEPDGSIQFRVAGNNLMTARRKQRRLNDIQTAYRLIHRSFLTSQISQYDAYLGRLLRILYLVRPEKLNNSEKQITFKELVQYSSLEEARERMIEREVDSVVRRSHEDQIGWLKENVGLQFELFLPELSTFIEIAQRRHLFVHCDGVVSAQYIKNCSSAGVKLAEEIVVGHQLEVSRQYLESAFETVYTVGVKIGLALWLNLYKGEINSVAKCANELAFELISNSRHSLAKNLLEFALNGKQKPTDEQTLRFIVLNLAQTYRWLDDAAKCKKLIADYDWAASSDVIRLGACVLLENYDEAFKLMRKLRHDEEFKRENYREWPIFREFRKQQSFAAMFKEVYGEDYEQAALVSSGAS